MPAMRVPAARIGLKYGARAPIFERMSMHYHVFETPRGFCAVAWSAAGLARFRLPEASAAATERALLRRLPDATPAAPPPEIADVVSAAQRYFAGERVEFGDAPLDLGDADALFLRIYDAARRLRWGETTTYGALAKTLGDNWELARDVGRAMAKNPIPLIIPCHRVLAAGGKIGGFSVPGGSATKAGMLEMEGVRVGAPSQGLLDV
jgi:methylated-DNA-[protein]-cysteine S-methyltransferase